MIQDFIVFAIIILALTNMGYRVYHILMQRKNSNCGGCASCDL